MCGIAGWADLEADLSEQQPILELMSEKLSHRGPDASGVWISPHAAFAHRRLIVVDPAGGGQPMVRRRGNCTYIIVYNGELYNTLDLRRELEKKGHVFLSSSDTEVLLTSYMEWGKKCVEHLNGIYAFGIWDEKRQRLFLARDRFGVKPLFYAQRGSSLIFASELKALLVHPLIKAEVNREGLAEVFALGPARTPGHGVFKDIWELKPSYSMTFDAQGIRRYKYWSLESYEHTDSLEDTSEVIRGLVKDAIERQLVADVPVCTFLSGGLDSSAISAYASNAFISRGLDRLNTYSVDYVDNELFFKPSAFQPNSDAPWIRRMADFLGTNHHNIVIDTPQLVEALAGALKARDLPGMADIDSSLWLFCREIKKNATVALSGECADEVFGGYPWFHREDLMNAGTFPWACSLSERTAVMSHDLYEFIRPEEYVAKRYEETLAEVPRLPGESPLEARRREIFYLNITWFMTTLLDRKDRMSMAHGLEVRVPYCDHRLVQYVWNIPWDIKFWNGLSKGILRHALRGVLPEDVLMRSKSPYPKTHNPAYEAAVGKLLLEVLNDSNSALLPLIDVKAVRALAQSKSDYGKPWFGQLMATPQMFAYLVQVDAWLKEYHISIV
ncbi:MAG: asparagine synthase (glutamine-hydrolyzing) [Clostridiales bacterium]|jgi:asparagine synthase (glutamine-hydrolysing)|nr:asparagine synthase (glutamine-hydrolyzing) [Eubacteriales bacterium]MDH7566586.1 asparagine synthase (glutamine-hydrolyzing) [Clostridiales bacterium]